MNKWKKCWVLFRTMLVISSTANSGYAIMSVVKSTFVKKYGWISEKEMEDYIALIQGAPGPLAINISLAAGNHVAGPMGAAAAVLGCALPPVVIMLLVSAFYSAIIGNRWVGVFMHGMQAGVIAMLTDMILDIVRSVMEKRKIYPAVIMVGAFLFGWLVKGSSLPVVVTCIALGCLVHLAKSRRKESGK